MLDGYQTGLLVPLHEEYQYLTEIAPATRTVSVDGDYYYELMPQGYAEPIIVQVLEDMGTVRAALAAERLLTRFRASIVCLLGIAGALDRDLCIGDVVIASEVDYYQYGAKATSSRGAPVLAQSGMHWRASHAVLEAARSFGLRPELNSTYSAWRKITSSRRPASDDLLIQDLLRSEPTDAVGPIASGDVVGAARWFHEALLKRNRKLLALEMEAAGVAAAATGRANPAQFLVVRGISDFADERKDQLDQAREKGSVDTGVLRRYAVLSAAEYLLRFLPVLIDHLAPSQVQAADSEALLPTANFDLGVGGPSIAAPEASGRMDLVSADRPQEVTRDKGDVRSELEQELATKYYSNTSVRRLLTHANIPWQSIEFSASAVDLWFAALELAESHARMCDLLRLVRREYPNRPIFTEASRLYGC